MYVVKTVVPPGLDGAGKYSGLTSTRREEGELPARALIEPVSLPCPAD
jgi:hypothetical protein